MRRSSGTCHKYETNANWLQLTDKTAGHSVLQTRETLFFPAEFSDQRENQRHQQRKGP